MTEEWEADLRNALVRASEGAPLAPRGLSAHVAMRSRRRKARQHAMLAAAMVAVVAGGIGIAVRDGGKESGPTAVNPTLPVASQPATGSPAPDEPASAKPSSSSPSGKPAAMGAGRVEDVWPRAVWKIPAKSSNGRTLRPQLFIDDRTLLMETWASFEKTDAIHAYDLETGDIRKLATIRTPKGVFAGNFAVGAGKIVWQTIEATESRRVTTFWSVPIEGGTPQAIATDRPVEGGGDKLTVVGDRLAFSVMEGGVFTVPLAGGAVRPVADAEDHHILRWPWVGTPGRYTPNNETSFQTLLNAETGEVSEALIRPGEKYVRCGVVMCAGKRPDETDFYRLRDGSDERDLPDWAAIGLAADRFMTVNPPKGGQALYDLATGRSADLGLRPDANGQSVSVQPALGDGRLVYYPLGKELVVIDLTRIE
ncbi:hypothetical protein ACIBH1_38020 [Nonomuraea sp. NPDC050663]|uniref:hypothetical protein n=1 Tax=Nonomuraea sp. NPDC050663 TaxID=3364370 RepID=UPI0037A7FCC2